VPIPRPSHFWTISIVGEWAGVVSFHPEPRERSEQLGLPPHEESLETLYRNSLNSVPLHECSFLILLVFKEAHIAVSCAAIILSTEHNNVSKLDCVEPKYNFNSACWPSTLHVVVSPKLRYWSVMYDTNMRS